jgi:hypothetical protein
MGSATEQLSSFTRKLYRWGFRKLANDCPHFNCSVNDKVFRHPNFQRDDKPLALLMKSITAEGKRKALSSQLIAELNARDVRDQTLPLIPFDVSSWQPLPVTQASLLGSSSSNVLFQSNLIQSHESDATQPVTPFSFGNACFALSTSQGQPQTTTLQMMGLPVNGHNGAIQPADRRIARLTNPNRTNPNQMCGGVSGWNTGMLQLNGSSQDPSMTSDLLLQTDSRACVPQISEAGLLWELRRLATQNGFFDVSGASMPSTDSQHHQTINSSFKSIFP